MIQTRLELYQKVTPLAKLGIWERNLITGEIYWNAVIRSIYEVEEDYVPILEGSLAFYLNPEAVTNLINNVQQTGEQYTVQLQIKATSGSIKWVRLRIEGAFKDGVCFSIYGTLEDITSYKKYTELLLLERQRLDNIIKSTQIGTWEWNIKTDQVTCNQQSLDLLGYKSNSTKMGFMSTWHDLIHPDDREANKAQLEICFSKKRKFYRHECRMSHKNEDWIWIECRGKVIEWSESGEPLFMLGTYADIHHRKSLHEGQKKAMKVISEQNERLMDFAHIVSHNLRSHTGNIQMLIEVMQEETDPEERNKLMQMLDTNTANLQQTLLHLNDVIKMNDMGTQYTKELNLRTEIDKTLKVLSESIKNAGASITVEVDPALNITYIPAYLESILLNLISNSITYRSPERPLHIQISANGQSPVLLKVKDNGLGLDMNMHGHKLFGMYKTFHGNVPARGIGLFLVKNQVKSMGGEISAESEPDKGAVFTVEII